MAFSRAKWYQNARKCTYLLLQLFIHHILGTKKLPTKLWAEKIEDEKSQRESKLPCSFMRLVNIPPKQQLKLWEYLSTTQSPTAEKTKGYGERQVVPVYFSLGLRITQKAPQRSRKAPNSTSNSTRTRRTHTPKWQPVTFPWPERL